MWLVGKSIWIFVICIGVEMVGNNEMRWDWIGWDEGVLLFFGWNEIEMRWYWEVWYCIGNCEDEKILDWGLGVNPNPSGWD